MTIAGAVAVSAALGGCLESDTESLTVGECVDFDATDFTFGGDVSTVDCSELAVLNSVYRVVDTGSEDEMDRRCGGFNLIIVDGDDAACLGK